MLGFRRRHVHLAWLPLGALAWACLFDPYEARDLPCEDDDDCGPKLECDPITFECDDPGDDDDGGDEGNSCLPADSPCSEGSTPCCGDTLCVAHSYGRQVCTPYCATGLDCGTCCCGPTSEWTLVCAYPEEYCDGDPYSCRASQCSLSPSLCSVTSDCCSGLCWPNAAGSSSCFTTCITASDCNSGCCSAVGSVTGAAVCQSADVCYGESPPAESPRNFTSAVDPRAALQVAAGALQSEAPAP